jgi:parallel beta-helix repeat protein
MKNGIFGKGLAVAIVILFVGSCVVPSTGINIGKKSSKPIATGNILYVGGSGSDNYTKIQDAINAANPGDIVYVYSGIYYEHVMVDKTITLMGENRDNTIIDGMEDGDVVIINVNSVSISGFTIQNASKLLYDFSKGIKILSSYNTISNNNIGLDYNYYGIYGENSNYNNISGNNIKDNKKGICLGYSSNNDILDNQFSNENIDIELGSSSNDNIISDNIINSIFPYTNEGIRLYVDCCNNYILDNTINSISNKGIGIYDSSDNNIISGNRISNSSCGIIIADSKENTIDLNNIKRTNQWGIKIERCSNCVIFTNTITEVKLDYGEGIIIDSCSSTKGNTLCENVISKSYTGIRIYDSENNLISGNNVSDNELGINLNWWSYYNTISGNTFSNNGIGIHNSVNMSNNNIIYYNNFFNSSNQHGLDCGNNTWDNGYPSGGNYWDDYIGSDNNGDGIGDTPYSIPGGDNKDRYPLMEPWVNHPPNVPSITGQTNGKINVEYTYTTNTTDPDDDQVAYYVDWGDGTNSGWTTFYNSGEEASVKHTWTVKGTYEIKVKAKDIHDAESNWSTLTVTMPLDLQIIQSNSQQINSQSSRQSQNSPSNQLLHTIAVKTISNR